MTALSVKLAGLTDPGKVRSNNEDAVWADAEQGLLIVADGMGGMAAGEVASAIAISSIPTNFKQLTKANNAGEIADKAFSAETNRLGFCLKMANQLIFEASKRYPQDNGMGTTCTAILVRGDRLSIAHVGDSRCYLIRRGQLEQLTVDHSLAMEQVKHGLLTPEQAAHTNQNILTRSLGTAEEVQIDLDEHPLFDGDTLVLCSDGLDKEVTNDEVLDTAMKTSEPLELAKRLIDRANASGGRDNISVAVARMQKASISASIKKFFGSK